MPAAYIAVGLMVVSVPIESQLVRHEIGHEGGVVIEVPDAVPNPHAMLRDAASATFTADAQYYPGIRAPLPEQYSSIFCRLAAQILRLHFDHQEPVVLEGAYYAIVTTPPERLMPPQCIPHYDAVCDRRFAIVHYLSENDLGGTGFFRHQSTAFESITEERQSIYFRSLKNDIGRIGRPAQAYMHGDTPIYECIARFDSIFNRALFYRGNALHSGLIAAGASLPANALSGRLTAICFFSI